MAEIVKSLVIGAAAGLVAAFAMERAQAALASRLAAVRNQEGESSTVRAADRLAVRLGGGPLQGDDRAKGGELVHYATGAGLGALYGLAVHGFRPVSAGFGVLYGLAVAAVLDDVVVPALGLGPGPTGTPREVHLYSLGSHAVFGGVLEGARRALTPIL